MVALLGGIRVSMPMCDVVHYINITYSLIASKNRKCGCDKQVNIDQESATPKLSQEEYMRMGVLHVCLCKGVRSLIKIAILRLPRL